MPDLPEAIPSPSDWSGNPSFGWLWELVESVLAVWLLANFDLRSHAFRIRGVVVVVALEGLGILLPLVLDFKRRGAIN